MELQFYHGCLFEDGISQSLWVIRRKLQAVEMKWCVQRIWRRLGYRYGHGERERETERVREPPFSVFIFLFIKVIKISPVPCKSSEEVAIKSGISTIWKCCVGEVLFWFAIFNPQQESQNRKKEKKNSIFEANVVLILFTFPINAGFFLDFWASSSCTTY